MKEEFKLFLSRLLPIVLILFGIPLISYLIWFFTPVKTLDILVLDKTVRDKSYQEHQGVFWVLDHSKYQNSQKEFYDKSADYLGFFPDDSPAYGTKKDLAGRTRASIDSLVSQKDLVFIADTYGVFENDFSRPPLENPSKKIYGGMDISEIHLINSAKQQGKTVVAEYNAMASPTPKPIRTEFENLMGIKWTGWIGRYFDELDTIQNGDIPGWMRIIYRKQHGAWDLSGPGLIFIKESGEMEAFLFNKDFQNKTPLIRTQKVNKHGFKLPQVVPYPDWFDVVLIERDYQVISYYDINPTPEGVQRLRSMGLPRFFPAVVYRQLGKGRQYYFAGDFSEVKGDLGSPRFSGLPFLWRSLYVTGDFTDRRSFFWNYYQPLLEQILEEARKSTN
ncbi:hypothetical protein [Algoriphagus sp. AK58]|uniref:hypothetical protein n=1 Tax=Algoriphagus sp. AK58 TaxID=1406877 RepID=UPI0016509F0F|nr:hypothetical protein [Algoriphagus sp. AK58]MBC6369140.1 hypothetical protein [Algoriphagus sp. AK58]